MTICSLQVFDSGQNQFPVRFGSSHKGVSSSLFRSGTRPVDLPVCSLGGVSGFNPVKGVPNFMFGSSLVDSLTEGGREAFLGKGARSSPEGLRGLSGKGKFIGSDNVCLFTCP